MSAWAIEWKLMWTHELTATCWRAFVGGEAAGYLMFYGTHAEEMGTLTEFGFWKNGKCFLSFDSYLNLDEAKKLAEVVIKAVLPELFGGES